MFIRTALIAAALIIPAAAQADVSAKVAYRPSELSTSAGRRAVAVRIKRSVNGACWGTGSLMEEADCRRIISADMLSKIGNAQLAAAYGGQATAQG